MSSTDPRNSIALALTVSFIIGVLLYGLLIVQQVLLAVLVALVGGLVYIVWRLLQ